MYRSVLSLLLIVGVVGTVGLVYAFWPEKTNEDQRIQQERPALPKFDVAKFEPRTVIPRSFPAIVEPESATVAEAATKVRPKDLVLGVEVNGVARAYPINMLSGPTREIVNDELGGQMIAATW